jgi:hypothetical protein
MPDQDERCDPTTLRPLRIGLSKQRRPFGLLVERAGLDVARYDASLLQEVARALGLPSDDFSDALKREQVSIEMLLTQLLRILEPYAGMTNDILALFARASARRSNNNLRMRSSLIC